MIPFELHDPATAPAGSRAILANVESAWGEVPELHRLLAESPPALEAYCAAFAFFERSALTPVERRTVHLAIASAIGGAIGGADGGADDDAAPTAEERLRELAAFARSLALTRGRLDAGELEAFLDAGYTRRNALEVVLAISIGTISVCTRGLAASAAGGDGAITRTLQTWEQDASGLARLPSPSRQCSPDDADTAPLTLEPCPRTAST